MKLWDGLRWEVLHELLIERWGSCHGFRTIPQGRHRVGRACERILLDFWLETQHSLWISMGPDEFHMDLTTIHVGAKFHRIARDTSVSSKEAHILTALGILVPRVSDDIGDPEAIQRGVYPRLHTPELRTRYERFWEDPFDFLKEAV